MMTMTEKVGRFINIGIYMIVNVNNISDSIKK